MKTLKKHLKIELILLIFVLLISTLYIISREKITIATDYIPGANYIINDSREVSILTKKILYPPLIELSKNNEYKLNVAKNIRIDEENNNIEITLKNEKTAKIVVDAYLDILSKYYEEAYSCENIIGAQEYINKKANNIEGIKQEKNKVIFNVKDTKDLKFLETPLDNKLSKYKVKKVTDKELILKSFLSTIEFKLRDNLESKDIDIYITRITDIEDNNFNKIEIAKNSNFIGTINYTKEEVETIQKIVNEEIIQPDNIKEIEFWNDPSEQGVFVLETLKNKCNLADIKLNYDYCQTPYLYKLANSNKKFIFFYDGDYLEENNFKVFDTFNKVEINIVDTAIYYRNKVEDFVKKYNLK